jgi:acyl carrier protein
MFRRVPVALIRAAKKVSQPRSVGKINVVARPVMQFNARSFGTAAAATGKAEPFLDPKMVTDRVIEVIKNFEKVDAKKVTANARFKDDIGLDSLDAVELLMAIEEEFCIEIPDSEADKIMSVPDAVAYISGHPMAK